MNGDLERELAIADAEMKAANARRYAALLRASDSARGCSVPICPGPKVYSDGACPMGWSGSCRRGS